MEWNLRKEEATRGFWHWFSSVASILEADFESTEVHEELDQRLSVFGDITWELGPGRSADSSMLAISPDGEPELLPLTQRIVSLAPKIPGWEFYPSRQVRDAPLEIGMFSEDGTRIDVDVESWSYVLYSFSEGDFDICIEQPDLGVVDLEDRYAMAIMVLDGMIGEEVRMSKVREVEVCSQFTEEQRRTANGIELLARHLDRIA